MTATDENRTRHGYPLKILDEHRRNIDKIIGPLIEDLRHIDPGEYDPSIETASPDRWESFLDWFELDLFDYIKEASAGDLPPDASDEMRAQKRKWDMEIEARFTGASRFRALKGFNDPRTRQEMIARLRQVQTRVVPAADRIGKTAKQLADYLVANPDATV